MPGVEGTMKEFEKGTLHSGSKTGPKVKSKAQAIAIGLSEERKAGKKVPPKPGSKEHRHAHMGKVLKKAHADYKKKYAMMGEEENPHNATRV